MFKGLATKIVGSHHNSGGDHIAIQGISTELAIKAKQYTKAVPIPHKNINDMHACSAMKNHEDFPRQGHGIMQSTLNQGLQVH
jgi:hypothetical protein